MYRRPSKKKELMKRVAVSTVMIFSVLIGVTGIMLTILGYRFDADNGRLEQGSLVQFGTIPPGATVTIDGTAINARTPSKTSVLAGVHDFSFTRDGYEVWNKTTDITAGTLVWLNYARLVPIDRPTTAVLEYPKLHDTLASVDGRYMIMQQDRATSSFQLVDLQDDDVTQTTLTLPSKLFTVPSSKSITHSYRLDSWDTGSRYVLVEHTFGSTKEWVVIDTQDTSKSKNINTILDIAVTTPQFSGTNGNIIYALNDGDVRKLDLSAGTISRALVTDVTSFELFDTNIITYSGTDPDDSKKRVAGIYKDGDDAPYILRTATAPASLRIATARYFGQDYVAISEGTTITVLSGSYPTLGGNDSDSLSEYGAFEANEPITHLGFSPKGYYILAQSNGQFTSYDIEHKRVHTGSVAGTSSGARPLEWLDDNYLWADEDGALTMREFDGANQHTINNVTEGFDATLTRNGRYLYSVIKNDTLYQLQRVRMILP